jgi:hypothetical protein
MTTQLSALLLLAAISGSATESAQVYDNYKAAWQAGREKKLPVLVIFNPGADSTAPVVDVNTVRLASHRRELLSNYVVAVIDTSTPEGEATHKLFKSPPLPRVTVLDRHQKFQIYQTSKALSAEDWNLMLEKYQKGETPVVAAKPAYDCPYCNR